MHTVRGTAPSARFVGYELVSTARQGKPGLGLEAQRRAIDDFVANRDATLVGRFTETESGRKTNRAEHDAALTMAQLNGTKARGHFPAHQGGAAGRKRTWETGHPERCGNAVGGMKGRCGA